MKILKYLLYILLALVVIVVILGLFGPKTYHVSRSKVIAASPEQLWPYLTSFPKTQLWTPFSRMDTTMTSEYSGEDGTVGAKMTWKSKKMGGGEQTITTLDPYKYANSELKFFQPWGEGHATSDFQLMDTVGGTKVTWGLNGENGFVNRAMGALMNMDKMMGPVFEKGLNSLDSLMATLPKPVVTESPIKMEDFPGGTYLAIRKKIKISELKDFFTANFQALVHGGKSVKAEGASPPTAFYYTWDPEKNMTDCAAAIPITNKVKAPAGISLITIPASKAAVYNYMGGYSGIGKAHDEMAAYLKANNLTEATPVIEQYLVDGSMESDTFKWQTRIVYLLK